MSDFWTPDKIETLVQMVRAGHTRSHVASVLGCTSNAVIGKYNRLCDRQGIERPHAAPRKRRVQPSIKIAEDGFILPLLPPPVPPKGQGVGILDVTGCKWPVADDASLIGGKAFCNAEKCDSRYCAYHARESVASYSDTLIQRTLGQVRRMAA